MNTLMKHGSIDHLRECQLAAIGKVLAGYTHELKNHLAIIKETSGLMSDLLDITEGEDEKIRQKFRKIIFTIEERVSEANKMARHLNSFAHRMDTPDSTFNVNDLLDEEIALIERFARLKNIILIKDFSKEVCSTYNNPSLFQFIVFTDIYKIIEECEDSGEIIISSFQQQSDITVVIKIKCKPSNNDNNDLNLTLDAVKEAIKKTEIRRAEKKVEDKKEITLIIPAQ